MKKLILVVIIISSLFTFLNSCISNYEEKYSNIEIGQNFGSNIDGYQKKLPHDFCLDVSLGSKARLIKIPYEKLNVPYFTNSVYNTPAVIEGHFIKGWYDDNVVILCEETSENIRFVVVEFETLKIDYVSSEQELDEYGNINWFTLCNTFDEIID
ncbi:MAG: hypothetical protein IKM34_03790 [Clostridia bacterium]|nr:hypothetical protein [Clostridia bacterium]